MLNRPPGDKMGDIDKHFFVLKFMSSSKKNEAVFLARNYSGNVHSINYTDEKPTAKKLFDVTQRVKIGNFKSAKHKLENLCI